MSLLTLEQANLAFPLLKSLGLEKFDTLEAIEIYPDDRNPGHRYVRLSIYESNSQEEEEQ